MSSWAGGSKAEPRMRGEALEALAKIICEDMINPTLKLEAQSVLSSAMTQELISIIFDYSLSPVEINAVLLGSVLGMPAFSLEIMPKKLNFVSTW